MQHSIDHMKAPPKPLLHFKHKLTHDLQQCFGWNGILHSSNLINGFLKAETFVCQQTIHVTVTLGMSAFCVPFMYWLIVIDVA